MGSFYDEVLRELLLALGAALFLANAFALAKRRDDGERAAARSVARHRPGSPVRGYKRSGDDHDLAQAPVGRTVLYMVAGLVISIWALASLMS
ncbi:MAG TPA: hypothetical protein VFX21_08985 [Acidimicrobiia bacterium]|nr:hypothetical protein [Acidimicrobiia bacterium]